jgi:hypothetical protein
MALKIDGEPMYKPTGKLYDSEKIFIIKTRYNSTTQYLTLSHVEVMY